MEWTLSGSSLDRLQRRSSAILLAAMGLLLVALTVRLVYVSVALGPRLPRSPDITVLLPVRSVLSHLPAARLAGPEAPGAESPFTGYDEPGPSIATRSAKGHGHCQLARRLLDARAAAVL